MNDVSPIDEAGSSGEDAGSSIEKANVWKLYEAKAEQFAATRQRP